MGRLAQETAIQHFSHPHPLHLTSNSGQQNPLIPLLCAACTLPCSSPQSWTYTCSPCNYSLHLSCSQLPPLIHHLSHPPHSLSLLSRPTYPEGYFHCDACDRTGTGFSYHCPACTVDLHTACASMALSVRHHAHPHPLTLAFSSPYDTEGFSCDVCGGLGGNHWLYRCAPCGFDAHLGCGSGPGPMGRSMSQPQGMVAAQAQPAVVRRMGSTGGLMRQVGNGLLDGITQQLGQNLVNGFMGGGGEGGSDGGDVGTGDGLVGSVMNIGGAVLGNVLRG